MPWLKHLCAHPGCKTLLARKSTVHCRKHHIKTPEHLAKIRDALLSRKLAGIPMNRTRAAAIIRKCLHCGERFTPPKKSSKQRFCSPKCGYAHRTGANAKGWQWKIQTTNCLICGKTIRPSSVNVKRKTCSRSCKAILGRKTQKRTGTKIERLIAEALTNAGIKFKAQFVVPNVCIPDFYIPTIHAAVFCDGDYWHRLPAHATKDTRDNLELERRGYRVIRFWEKDILKNAADCVEQLQNLIPCRISGTLL